MHVDGSINDIFISNSKYDGLDVDFGNIKFKNVLIQNSGNDCVDLNFGNYYFENLIVYSCYNPLDTENSFVEFLNLKIYSKEKKMNFRNIKFSKFLNKFVRVRFAKLILIISISFFLSGIIYHHQQFFL